VISVRPPLELVVACDQRGLIGREGQLPWQLPDDLRRFRAVTMGKPLLMGRRTYDSIGRPLPGRISRVLSRDPAYAPEGIEVHRNLESAWDASSGAPALMVIGGGELYRQTLPLADRLLLTEVQAEVVGDVYLPPIDLAGWVCVEEIHHPADERHAHAFTFRDWRRAGAVLRPLP
jgi:dihydrofolate reductase